MLAKEKKDRELAEKRAKMTYEKNEVETTLYNGIK